MEKGQTVLWIMVGVLIIAGIAGGVYYLGRQTTPKPSLAPAVTSQTPQPTPIKDASPTPNGAVETVNWKTYTDPKLKFSLKYPDDGSIVVARVFPEGGVELIAQKDEQQYKATGDFDLMISVLSREGSDPENVLRNGGECPKPCNELTEKVRINNAIGINTLGPNFSGKHNYWLTDENKKGEVVRLTLMDLYSFQGKASEHKTEIELFERILNTFKFER